MDIDDPSEFAKALLMYIQQALDLAEAIQTTNQPSSSSSSSNSSSSGNSGDGSRARYVERVD